MKTSKGEQKVIDILQKEKLNFTREVSFLDLQSYRGGRPRFDFVVYKGTLREIDFIIEFDGEQHFRSTKVFGNSEFKYRQSLDRLKNSYCLARGIKLYRIPFYDYDKINSLRDILLPQYLVTTKWHNDIIRENLTK